MMRQFVGDARGQLFVILGAVILVLLIACANVANLLLARGAARGRELAIRASIGAGRGRLVRQLLAESGALALSAAVVGTAVAWVVVRTLVAAAPPSVPRIEQARLDGATLIFAALLAMASTLLFGLAPAIRTARTDLIGALRTGQVRATGSRRDWFRQGLVTSEVALALMLLMGAGLLVRTAIHLQRLDPGFEPRGVVTARIALPPESSRTWPRHLEFEAPPCRLRFRWGRVGGATGWFRKASPRARRAPSTLACESYLRITRQPSVFRCGAVGGSRRRTAAARPGRCW
jgi:hypothetical protein